MPSSLNSDFLIHHQARRNLHTGLRFHTKMRPKLLYSSEESAVAGKARPWEVVVEASGR